ncbi:LysR substrate-binding domain-containing protein [Teichococcus vastitatis]|uniref:LysR substrate-binding domain-containing protein n=1 Tax=Teichococcus vastitatis TaxID=2307076 RepID=A0ABS9W7R3_9PROT|nr:LysR substrate-binding domain-containing protein [Pseudoroseomonas vastitatis]MCI0755261.1 LysR substrate-binding domain-containing protein [Pseudoroseomonas vastitatis]
MSINGVDMQGMLSLPPGLDPDLLRSFVLIADGASVTRAAQRVGRTQSAVSMQMRRLEEALGRPLLVRGPRGFALTPHGTWLLDRARPWLSMHDEIVANFRAQEVSGPVRLGTPDDYAMGWLPEILARFAEVHPAVEIEVVCAPSSELLTRLEHEELDLTLYSAGNELRGQEGVPLWRGPLLWVGSVAHSVHRQMPLRLSVAQSSCVWRAAATAALDAAGLPWRVTYSSSSQLGTHAVVLAGLAITVGLEGPLPPGLRVLSAADGLPPLPEFQIALAEGSGSAAAKAMARHIIDSFRREEGGLPT